MGRFEKIVGNFVKDLVINEYDFEFREFSCDFVKIAVGEIVIKISREINLPEKVEKVKAEVYITKGREEIRLSKTDIEDAYEIFGLIEDIKKWKEHGS